MRVALICKSTAAGLKYIIIISIWNTWKWGWQKVLGTDSVNSQSRRSSEWAGLGRTSVFSELTDCKWPQPLCRGALSQTAAANYSYRWSCLQTTVMLQTSCQFQISMARSWQLSMGPLHTLFTSYRLDLFWKPSCWLGITSLIYYHHHHVETAL